MRQPIVKLCLLQSYRNQRAIYRAAEILIARLPVTLAGQKLQSIPNSPWVRLHKAEECVQRALGDVLKSLSTDGWRAAFRSLVLSDIEVERMLDATAKDSKDRASIVETMKNHRAHFTRLLAEKLSDIDTCTRAVEHPSPKMARVLEHYEAKMQQQTKQLAQIQRNCARIHQKAYKASEALAMK